MSVQINNILFPAEYLTNPEDITKGMMGRDSLDGCVVFQMGMGHHSFWMKNCLINLDIIFVLKNRISRIHLDCPPSRNLLNPPHYTGIGDYVIEFPSGTANNWKVGDKVNMYLGSKFNPVR